MAEMTESHEVLVVGSAISGGPSRKASGAVMKSVVTGAHGFLGQALVDELVSRGNEVVAVDNHFGRAKERKLTTNGRVAYSEVDVTRAETLLEPLQDADEIYHCAGMLGTAELDSAVRDSVNVNILGTLNVIETALKNGVPRLFLASKPNVWLNMYSITKYCAEQIGRLYTRYHPICICSLRYMNLYGPRQKLYSVRKIIPVFAVQAMRRLPIQVYGDGEQTVDMLFSKDAARLTVDFVQTGVVDCTPDCGTGQAMTVNSVAAAVNSYFGSRAGIVHVPMRRGDTGGTRLVADTTAMRRILGPLSLTEWQQGLAETLDWYAQLKSHEIDAALTYHGLAQPLGMDWDSDVRPSGVAPVGLSV